MRCKRTWRWLPAALLLALGWAGMCAAGASDLEITSLSVGGGKVVFRSPGGSTSNHSYRVESTTSLVAAAWSVQATAGGVGAAASVTSPVTAGGSARFYRVVATSNSAAFVDGAYLSVDLSEGTNAASYPVTYYCTLADVPGGANSDAYKTTNILLRLIPKGTFTMGSQPDELGRSSNETQHQVTLTKDFYIGVFEVTQRQWELVMGNKPSYFNNATCNQTRPVENVSYYAIREDPSIPGLVGISPNWPATNAVHANSFMGKLRAKTGLAGFDLPTESQWAYACRAGTAAALNSGHNLTNVNSDARMAEVGRYWYNGGSGYTVSGDTSVSTAKVGSYQPNAWGLYDMHGNVWEWCLDWFGTYPGTVTDPPGSSLEMYRVFRGGSWYNSAYYCRSAFRKYIMPEYRFNYLGFRVCCAPPDQP